MTKDTQKEKKMAKFEKDTRVMWVASPKSRGTVKEFGQRQAEVEWDDGSNGVYPIDELKVVYGDDSDDPREVDVVKLLHEHLGRKELTFDQLHELLKDQASCLAEAAHEAGIDPDADLHYLNLLHELLKLMDHAARISKSLSSLPN